MNNQRRLGNGRFAPNEPNERMDLMDLMRNLLNFLNLLLWIIKNSPFLLLIYICFKYFDLKRVSEEIMTNYICNCKNESDGKKPGYF